MDMKIKKNEIKNNNNNMNKNNVHKTKIFKSKITVILIAIVIITIAIVVTLNILNIVSKNKEYKKYEEIINMYGFDQVYDNKSSKTLEKVTKSEAVKMALTSVYNNSNIAAFESDEKLEYDNQDWVNFAVYKGIIPSDEITKENANKPAKYIDVIRYFANAKSKLLKLDLNTDDINVKNVEGYTPDEQMAIKEIGRAH